MHGHRVPESISILKSVRRKIETVIGQLTDRFNIEKVRARDMWHMTNIIARKILGHTVGILLNCFFYLEPLQFDGLMQV